MHAKGYFFNKGELSTIIIGAQTARKPPSPATKSGMCYFIPMPAARCSNPHAENSRTFGPTQPQRGLTATWINEYDRYITKKEPLKPAVRSTFKSGQTVVSTDGESTITPNSMQQHALEALEVLHDRNEQKALLISATGTGKTYLSAFDVLATKPQRVLFLAHRMRILDASRKSFETVLGNRYTYETYGAGSAKPKAQCTFAMVEALRRHIDESSLRFRLHHYRRSPSKRSRRLSSHNGSFQTRFLPRHDGNSRKNRRLRCVQPIQPCHRLSYYFARRTGKRYAVAFPLLRHRRPANR